MNTIFAYHSGEQALVFPHHETGKPVSIKVLALLQAGWKITDGGCRKELPRFDRPTIQVESPSRLHGADIQAAGLHLHRAGR